MVPHNERPPRGLELSGVAALLRLPVLATLLMLAFTPDVNAQHLRGHLIDVETGDPIPLGHMSLLAADSSVVTTALSDGNGFWRLNVPRPGVYHVAAERLGYASMVSGQVEIGADDDLETVFHLRPVAVVLDPIEVRAAAVRRYLEYTGFFERQRSNFGHFVTPEAIERRQASRLTDLITGIPGVTRVYAAGGSVGPAQIQLRGSSLSQGGMCRPRVFVDGMMYTRGDSRPLRRSEADATEQAQDDIFERMDQALSLDDIGHPSTIAAIEVYRSASQVPVQFGGTSVETLCGVIVVWTHTGRLRAGGPTR